MLTKKDRNEILKRKFIDLKLNNKSVRMQLDMGSDISIIEEKTWKTIRKPYLYLTRKMTWSFCGNKPIFRG